MWILCARSAVEVLRQVRIATLPPHALSLSLLGAVEVLPQEVGFLR